MVIAAGTIAAVEDVAVVGNGSQLGLESGSTALIGTPSLRRWTCCWSDYERITTGRWFLHDSNFAMSFSAISLLENLFFIQESYMRRDRRPILSDVVALRRSFRVRLDC